MSQPLSRSAGEFLRHRREDVADHATRIGLDFLEVLPDPDDPAGRLLMLHFIPGGPGKLAVPAGLQPESFRFTAGGVPVDGLFTLGPSGGLAAVPGLATVEVAVRHAGDTELARRLGGAPVFTLELTGVADLDPFFSRLDFSLELDVPLEDDCQPGCPPVPAAAAPLAADYLAKDYASFRQRMLDHLAQKLPEWSERSPADLLVTLVELLADAADQASYYQDAVATEAYLGTARLRTSVRRHARLVGYHLHEGANARLWAQLEAGGSGTLPAGTRLLTRVPLAGVQVDPASPDYVQALAAGAAVFEILHDLALQPDLNEMTLYDWGADEYGLPGGATAAELRGDFTGTLLPRAVLILEQVLGETTGDPVDADRALRHAVRLTSVAPDEDPLAGPAGVTLTRIEWDPGDALPFPLRLAAVIDGEVVRGLAVARGNVVLAGHGRTVSEELTVPDLQGRPFRPRLQRRGLTHSTPYDHGAALGLPAAAALAPPASNARPALELTGTDGPWTLRRDLLGSDRFARDFVVEMETDGTAALRFGDGTLGRPPAPGTTLTATYRVGQGTVGNIGRDSLVHLAATGVPVLAVRNPLPGVGGIDPEPPDAARLAAPGSIDVLEGGSAVDEVVALALAHPGVERAAAGLRWTGSWYLLEVAVQRKGGLPATAGFLAEVRAGLEDSRIAGWELAVVPLRPVGLDIALTVLLDPEAVRGKVERDLLEVFSNRDLPGGRRGFFHPANLGFGETIYLSRIVQAALAVPGVRAVDLDGRPPRRDRFRRFGEPSRGELASGEIRLRRGEVARVDNDPAFPQNGTFELFLEGGR
jgi:hypothetical protein